MAKTSTPKAAPAPEPSATTAEVLQLRTDEWANFGTGMGVAGIDNRLGWLPYATSRQQQLLRRLWLGDGLAGRIVELPAEEMTREGAEVNLGEGYDEAEKQLRADLDEFDVWSKFSQVLKYDRAYGGGALILALDDGMPWSEPVDVRSLRRVKAIHYATPDELTALTYFDDPDDDTNFGKPATYRWQPQSIPMRSAKGGMRTVHASRVIAFTGLQVDHERLVENQGWGDSVLARCQERIRDTASALAGVGVGLQNFAQDVMGLDNLKETLGAKDGIQRLRNRAEGMRFYKSSMGILFIDSKETYKREGLPMAGVADALTQFANFLSATTGIPVSILFGYSNVGLGDTGATQVRTFHDWVKAQQKNRLKPGLDKLIRLMLLSQDGPTGGIEPPKWQVEFRPLERMTPQEEDARRKNQAEIDRIYVTEIQAYDAGAVAKSRFSGPTGFNPSTEVDASRWEPLPPVEEGAENEPAEPLETSTIPVAEEPTAAATLSQVESASDTALNGAQVTSAREIIASVGRRELPRASGVAMLIQFFNMEAAAAERVMGDVGRSFFVQTEEPKPPTTGRADEYAALLVQDIQHGGATPKAVEKELVRVCDVTPKAARTLIRTLAAQRNDAADMTHFPRRGLNKAVALRASRWPTFDPTYAQELKADWPEIWSSGGNLTGNAQFERLLPMARAGEAADTATEEHAVRLREAWAEANGDRRTPRTVVAMVKNLVVGRMGEAAMKRLLESEKERVRRRRAQET